jgi:hypothetical protein
LRDSPIVENVRYSLTLLLNTHLHQLGTPLAENQVNFLCSRVGIWPIPEGQTMRIRALEVFAARALPLFNAGVPETRQELVTSLNFERWCKNVESGDFAGARADARLLHLWSRGDSLSLRAP